MKTPFDTASGGYYFRVSDEKLVAFAKLNVLERLQWLEEAHRFTLLAGTEVAAARQQCLSRGERIDGKSECI
jgi:hypothetical protein